MITIIKLKKNAVIVLDAPKMEEGKADLLLKFLIEVFPNNKVVLPNGASLTILEPEE